MARKLRFLLFAFAVLTPTLALGSGFFTPEVGARAVARGGAYIVANSDLTSIYLNPGGLSRVKGTNLCAHVNYDVMHTYFRRQPYLPASWNRNPLDLIPFFAVSSDFTLKNWTFAFGGYGPYGVTQRYPQIGEQRYSVIEANSAQVYYTLAVGWHPLPWLRVGLDGYLTNFDKEDYYTVSVLGDKNPKYDVVARFLAVSEYMPGWSLGVIVEPVSWFQAGFSYIPPFEPTLRGTVKATLPDIYAAILGYEIYEDKITVKIGYPDQFRGGVRFLYKDKFDVELAFSYIPWSVLKGFPVDLEKEDIIADFHVPLNWNDSWSYRVGSTYKLNDHFQFHGGYYFEEPAAPEATVGPGGVESDRNAFSGGVTISYFGIDLDLAYAHVFMNDFVVDEPDTSSTLGDGRGKYKGDYDHMVVALNLNFENIYYTFKGGKSSTGENSNEQKGVD